MKRYLLFLGKKDTTGWNGFAGDFDTIDDAVNATKIRTYDWAEVIDSRTKGGKVVWTEFGQD